jgi:hypothetical protein
VRVRRLITVSNSLLLVYTHTDSVTLSHIYTRSCLCIHIQTVLLSHICILSLADVYTYRQCYSLTYRYSLLLMYTHKDGTGLRARGLGFIAVPKPLTTVHLCV